MWVVLRVYWEIEEIFRVHYMFRVLPMLTSFYVLRIVFDVSIDVCFVRCRRSGSASAPGLGSKRKATSALGDDERGGSASDDDYVAGRRRSTRTKVQQGNGNKASDVDSELSKSRGNAPKVGPNYQVEVPAEILPEADRTPEMVHVASESVFAPLMCKSEEQITQFLHSVDVELRKRDGFPLSPSGQEIALQILAKYKGEIETAHQEAVRSVGVGREFPGAGKPWSYEDKCLFVRALGETSKDFSYMSRYILKDRSTSELVFMYYTYHKQQKLQHGSRAGGNIFDTGSEPLTFLPKVGPDRVPAAIRSLAKTAGDGFPADRRVANFVREYRRNLTRRNHHKGFRNGTKYNS